MKSNFTKTASVLRITCALSVFAMCSSVANAQININRSDMPVSGEVFILTNVSDSIDVRSTAFNTTWDFSRLTDVTQDSFSYVSPTSINPGFGATFAGAVALKTVSPTALVQDNYSFYRSTNADYSLVGSGFVLPVVGLPFSMTYSSRDKIYTFPLRASSPKDSNAFSGQMSTPFFDMKTIGYRINEVDGSGSLKTPFGTFTTLRVKSYVFQVDTVAGMPINNSRTEYKWLAKGEKVPVLEVIIPDEGSNYAAAVRYKDRWKNLKNPNGPQVEFVADNTTIAMGETLGFTNLSTGGFIWEWSFNPSSVTYVDGTTNGSSDPSVVFNQAGKYTVSLKATGAGGSNTETKTDYITVMPVDKPVAQFNADKVTGNLATTFTFQDLSAPKATQHLWIFTPNQVAFQNGTNAQSPEPQVKFLAAGKYTVKLEVSNAGGSSNAVKANYITVDAGTGLLEATNGGLVGRDVFTVYPNPSSVGIWQLTALNADAQVGEYIMMNMNGQVVHSAGMEQMQTSGQKLNSWSIDGSSYASGIYYLQVRNREGGLSQVLKLVKP